MSYEKAVPEFYTLCAQYFTISHSTNVKRMPAFAVDSATKSTLYQETILETTHIV